MKSLLVLVIMSFSISSFAGNFDLSRFKERFEITKNEKGEKVIVDKSLLNDLGMDIYIKNLATYLTASDADVVEEIPNCKGFEFEKPDPKLMKDFKKAFDWMKKTNLGALLTDPKFLKFVMEVETETSKVINDPQFIVAANLENPTYFYKTAFSKFLSQKLIGLARSYFGASALLKPVTYIGDDYANFLISKKMYHQSILSYYLENMNPGELGLTETEKRRALSSIIDSKLSFGFGGGSESNKIKKNFDEYGYKKLMETDQKAEKLWSKNSELFDERIYKINSYFSEVVYQGELLIINLGDKKAKNQDLPSLAYDEKCSDFLYQHRRRYELIRVALGMSPIPYSSGLFATVKSKYQPQALSEGMFYGYLEATNQDWMMPAVLKQSMNPLLK